jgi:hypothetical protein
MNVYLAGGGSRPYVFMNLFLAGGISGNISKSWKELARQIIEQCESISQEKTERQESLETSWGGQTNELILGRGTSREKWPYSGSEGGAIQYS